MFFWTPYLAVHVSGRGIFDLTLDNHVHRAGAQVAVTNTEVKTLGPSPKAGLMDVIVLKPAALGMWRWKYVYQWVE